MKTLNSMECLDLKTYTWTQMNPMNTHRHGLGVALLGGTLYAVGGHDGWSYLNTVERFVYQLQFIFIPPKYFHQMGSNNANLELRCTHAKPTMFCWCRRSRRKALRGRRKGMFILLKVYGVLRPAHEQMDDVRANDTQKERSGRGRCQWLPIRHRWSGPAFK